MISNLKNDIKNLYYNLKRSDFLNKLNNVLSKNLVETDKVILYIDEYTIKRQFQYKEEYNLELYKIPQIDSMSEEQYQYLFHYYKLNKPFYYILDGITFDKKVILDVVKDATVIFKNCTFKEGIEITKCAKVIFEKNKYYCHGTYSLIKQKSFITGQRIDEIKFINESFCNHDYSHHPTPQFGINLIANNVEINNSKIDIDGSIIIDNKVYFSDKRSEMNIKAQNIKMINSFINCPNIYLESDRIINENCDFIATNGIVIENKNQDMNLENIKTPYLLYNREEIIKYFKAKPIALIRKLPLKRIN